MAHIIKMINIFGPENYKIAYMKMCGDGRVKCVAVGLVMFI
jgi:hypothetical protein